MNELSMHLDVLVYEYKRYIQSPGEGKRPQHMVRIHKQAEVRRFCEEVEFRSQDRADLASEFLTSKR